MLKGFSRWRFNEKTVGLACILLGLGGLLFSCSAEKNRSETWSDARSEVRSEVSMARTPCRVLTVYDGDTLGCDLDGDGRIRKPREEIRLLGIDSPEMHYSRKNRSYHSARPTDEPFAKEASGWMTAQAEGKTVYLAFDVRRSDRYGRTLAFAYLTPDTPVSLNEEELRQGLATTLFLGKNRRFEARFHQAETEARHAGRGLWREGGQTQESRLSENRR